MRPSLTSRTPAGALLAALAFLLVGCSGGSGTTVDDPAVEGSDKAEASDKAKSPDKAEAPADEVSASGAACIEGTWVTDPASVASAAIASGGLDGTGVDVVVTGDAFITFAGGSMTTSYENQAVEVTVDIEGQELRSVSRGAGVVAGSYTATDTEIVQSNIDASGLTMTIETYVDGQVMELPDMTQDLLAATEAGGTSTYTCSGDELRTTPVMPGVDTSLYVSVLHRR